ncbi:MAG: universal stress protein [Saprospiraceae bacterium]
MMDIKIYGTGTPTYQLAKSRIVRHLTDAGIDYQLHEVTKVTDIIKDDIMSVPAIKVNGNLLFEIKQNGSYNKTLRSTVQNILKVGNFGKMTKIIVPTDFSGTSFNAYNFANYLAKDLKGVILLTHVYYPTSTEANQFSIINDEAEKIHEKKLGEYVESLNNDWIGNFIKEPMIEGVFRVGFPRIELIEMSKQPGSVMVMGTTGEGDAFKKLFGSLSLDMLDQCHCPLFLIPPGAAYSQNKEIVYLSEDLKNDSLHLLYAGRLCMKMSTDLRIIHFKANQDGPYDIMDTKKLLESYYPMVRYNIDVVETSDLFSSIKDVVTDTDHQRLVVLSTKHRNLFQNLFHKSVTEYAALHSHASLLILSEKSLGSES